MPPLANSPAREKRGDGIDPWWTLRLGAVPFWTNFNTQVSARALEAYLDQSRTTRSTSCCSPTACAASGWRRSSAGAPSWRVPRQGGRFVGVDEQAYPADFAMFARYDRALRRLDRRWPVPSPLSWGEVLGQSDAACRRRRQHARGFQVPDPAVVRSSLQQGNRGTGRVVSHPRPAE
jgi:hypothetical protein